MDCLIGKVLAAKSVQVYYNCKTLSEEQTLFSLFGINKNICESSL